MIKAEVIELSNEHPIRTIIFTDSSGGCFRKAHYDKQGVPILEVLFEIHVNKMGVQSQSILVGIDYKLIAFRKYIWNKENRLMATEDYKLVGEEFKLINKHVYDRCDSNNLNVSKYTVFDSQNRPRYIAGGENGIDKFYTPEGEEIEDFAVYLYEHLQDIESIEDVSAQYMREAVKRLSNK